MKSNERIIRLRHSSGRRTVYAALFVILILGVLTGWILYRNSFTSRTILIPPPTISVPLTPWRIDGNSQWGYINDDGCFIIQPRFEDAKPFSEGLAFVRAEGKWGFINDQGRFVVRPSYDEGSFFSEYLALVKDEGGCHFIDYTGNDPFEQYFEDASSFSCGMAAVLTSRDATEDSGWRYLKKDGSYLSLPFGPISQATPFAGGFALVQWSRQEGDTQETLINVKGEEVNITQYSTFPYCAGQGGIVGRMSDEPVGQMSLYRSDGEKISESFSCMSSFFFNGRFYIRSEDWDQSLNPLIPGHMENKSAANFLVTTRGERVTSDGIRWLFGIRNHRGFCVDADANVRLVDDNCHRIGKHVYYSVDIFSENRAFVRIERDGPLRLINTDGEPVGDLQFTEVGPFHGGLSEASLVSGEHILINPAGQVVRVRDCRIDSE